MYNNKEVEILNKLDYMSLYLYFYVLHIKNILPYKFSLFK